VVRWLEAHPHIQLHFTPTRASWINLVERWFGLMREQATRRGSFDSVRRLEHAINRWLASWNDIARPFRWTKSRRQAVAISIDRQTNALSDQHLRALLTLRGRDRGRPSFVATRMRRACLVY
jgi:hypothetical protein